jgi:hypothetical protein
MGQWGLEVKEKLLDTLKILMPVRLRLERTIQSGKERVQS